MHITDTGTPVATRMAMRQCASLTAHPCSMRSGQHGLFDLHIRTKHAWLSRSLSPECWAGIRPACRLAHAQGSPWPAAAQQPGSSQGSGQGAGRAAAARAPWRTLPRARRRGRTPPARARTAPRSAWPPPPGSAGRAGAPRPVTLIILCDVTLMIWCNTATQYYVTAKQVAQALLALSIMMWCNVIMLLQSRSRRRSSPCYSEYSTRSLCYCTAPRRAGYLRVKQRPAAGRVSARR